MNKLDVSKKNLMKYFFSFFPSLRQYPENYLSLIFQPDAPVPEHMAYLCPMCLKNFIFFIPSQIRWSENFSLDHFPPKDVCGKLKALVCKPCNNKAGSLYESKLSETVEKECFNKKVPKAKIGTNVTITNVRGRHPGKLDIDEKGEYRFDLTTNQQKNLPELNAWEKQGGGDWEMTLTIKHADEGKFSKSLLKAAYLYCFNHWGYNFVFSESGNLIRQALNDESNYPIKVPAIWLDNKSQGNEFEKIIAGVIFIAEPKEMQSIFVNLPIELKRMKYKCILPIQIPNPTENRIEEMRRINQFILDQKLLTTKFAPINFPHPAMENSFEFTWQSLLQDFN